MHLSLSLRQKGLAIVMIPLLMQVGLLLVLFKLYQEAEAGEYKENRAKRIEFLCNRIGHLAYGGGASILMYMRLKDDCLSKRFEGAIAEVHTQVEKLSALVGKKSDEQTLLKEVVRHSDRTFALMTELKKTLDEGTETASLPHVGDLADELASTTAGLGESLRSLEQREVALVNKSPALQAAARLRIQQFILAGVAANVIMAIIIANFFSKSIANRIMLIVDNTRKLGTGKPLNPLMKGDDEIAKLDAVFHETSQAMEETARIRRELVSLVSHDLRTPLTAIRLNMGLLQNMFAEELPEKALKVVATTQKETNRLIRLIVDLLDLEKMEAGSMQLKLQEVPLQALFEDAQDAVLGFANDQGLQLEIEDTSEEVNADPERIIQVLVNFLSNAIKFSPKGGVIKMNSTSVNGTVKVSVQDQGPGIPQDYKQIIFERYKQIESQGKTKQGTGLGLAICKAIISEHHGQIGVDSEPGQPGSIFWFELPTLRTTDGKNTSS